MALFEATAPTRIDLAGGTLDIWPVYLFHPGAVTVNVAIDRRASCRIETGVRGVRIESLDTGVTHEAGSASALVAGKTPPLAAFVLQAIGLESGVAVTTRSTVPAGSGLGGSSTLAVAVVGAAAMVLGRDLGPDEIWPLTRDAEARCIAVPAGIQDYMPAIHGGALAMHLEVGAIRVESLGLEAGRIDERLLLVDAGATRFSGLNNWDVFKAQIDGDARVRAALASIAAIAARVRQALLDGDDDRVGELMAEEWTARKALAPAITTPDIDRLASVAAAAGGSAKVCGAGGGGTVAVWARSGRKAAIEAALREAGFASLPFKVDREGLRVVERS
jgi:D-glycero-alpha-D-manno-heptose-7-phosphate kinase